MFNITPAAKSLIDQKINSFREHFPEAASCKFWRVSSCTHCCRGLSYFLRPEKSPSEEDAIVQIGDLSLVLSPTIAKYLDQATIEVAPQWMGEDILAIRGPASGMLIPEPCSA